MTTDVFTEAFITAMRQAFPDEAPLLEHLDRPVTESALDAIEQALLETRPGLVTAERLLDMWRTPRRDDEAFERQLIRLAGHSDAVKLYDQNLMQCPKVAA